MWCVIPFNLVTLHFALSTTACYATAAVVFCCLCWWCWSCFEYYILIFWFRRNNPVNDVMCDEADRCRTADYHIFRQFLYLLALMLMLCVFMSVVLTLEPLSQIIAKTLVVNGKSACIRTMDRYSQKHTHSFTSTSTKSIQHIPTVNVERECVYGRMPKGISYSE